MGMPTLAPVRGPRTDQGVRAGGLVAALSPPRAVTVWLASLVETVRGSPPVFDAVGSGVWRLLLDPDGNLGAGGEPELGQGPLDMPLCRARGDDQLSGYLLVRQPLRD